MTAPRVAASSGRLPACPRHVRSEQVKLTGGRQPWLNFRRVRSLEVKGRLQMTKATYARFPCGSLRPFERPVDVWDALSRRLWKVCLPGGRLISTPAQHWSRPTVHGKSVTQKKHNTILWPVLRPSKSALLLQMNGWRSGLRDPSACCYRVSILSTSHSIISASCSHVFAMCVASTLLSGSNYNFRKKRAFIMRKFVDAE